MNVSTIAPSIARLNILSECVEILREVHPSMTLNQVMVLLLIASNPGISQNEIMEKANLTDSSASRIVAMLSEFGARGTGPFHLIKQVPTNNDRRFKALHLTKGGQNLINRLLNRLASKGGR